MLNCPCPLIAMDPHSVELDCRRRGCPADTTLRG